MSYFHCFETHYFFFYIFCIQWHAEVAHHNKTGLYSTMKVIYANNSKIPTNNDTSLQMALPLPGRWYKNSVNQFSPLVNSLNFSSLMFANRVLYTFFGTVLQTCHLCSESFWRDVLLWLDHASAITHLPVCEIRKSTAQDSGDNWKHSCFKQTAPHRDFFD